RQHLLLDPGLIHQFEPALDVVRRVGERVPRHAAFDRQMSGRGKTVAHERAEILWRVVRMYVADHEPPPTSVASCRGGGFVSREHLADPGDDPLAVGKPLAFEDRAV